MVATVFCLLGYFVSNVLRNGGQSFFFFFFVVIIDFAGHTLECLISKIYEAQQKDPKAAPLVDDACHHEIMRIAELQSEDFHLDRQLFFACREDREVASL